MDGDVQVFFDEECKVRILDAESFASSTALQENCAAFVESVQQLQDAAGGYVAAVDRQAVARIERERLRAVGLRNRVAALHEERRCRRQELLQQLRERQDELDRLAAEEDSLRRVRREQELFMARLSDPAGGARAGAGGV